MSATLFGRGLFGAHHFGYSPVGAGGVGPSYPLVHAIYFISTSITLKWHNPMTANLFQVQVNLRPDFSGSFILNSSAVTANEHTFTDSGTNDARRYWRWRYSDNSGSTWSRWSRVGSYWLNTSGAENVNVGRNQWTLIDESPVTDRYLFEIFPSMRHLIRTLWRMKERNRAGTLLSEYLTVKGEINLAFSSSQWLNEEEFSEVRRFSEEIKTFFLATFHDYELGQPVPNIWKVQYREDPVLTMYGAGRQDMFTGTLSFEEV